MSGQLVFAVRQVVVETKSSSGKSLKLNIGTLDGIQIGDNAEISIREGGLTTPKYKYLASGRVIKLFQNHSYWHFPELESGSVLKGKTYNLQLRRETVAGRAGVSIKYRVRTYESDQGLKDMRNGPRGELPSSLVQENRVFKNEVYQDQDYISADVEKEKHQKLSTKKAVLIDEDYQDLKYIRGDQNDVNREDISRAYKQKMGRDQNINQLKKISSKKYGYEQLYYDKTRNIMNPDDFIGTDNSVVAEYRERKLALEKIPDATREMIKKEGGLWSADMDKEELQEYLLKTGIAKERRRQANVIALKSGNEVSIYLGSGLSANYTTEDQSHQNKGLALGIAYNLHLVRASRSLERWSVDFLYEAGNHNVDVGGINGRITYTALGSHLNYYFYNFPHSHNKFAAFAGVGLKRGTGEMTSANLSKDYDYQVVSLPSAHLGLKYRVPAAREYEFGSSFGFGFNAKMTYESVDLSAVSTVEDDFISSTTVSSLRADFGISIFF